MKVKVIGSFVTPTIVSSCVARGAGERVMASIRHLLERRVRLKDNHIASAPVKIACDNDLSAVRRSQKFLDRHDIQLWQGRRLVTLLKGK